MGALNRRKVRWMAKEWERGEFSMGFICKAVRITPRHGRRLRARYEQTGVLPYPKRTGRKPKPITAEEKDRILAMKEHHPLSGANTLEKLLNLNGGHIPHNRIHHILKLSGKAKDDPKKQKRRKYIRYQRKTSNSLWHTDLFEKYEGNNVAILYEDDASRFMTGGQLLNRPTSAECVAAGQLAVAMYGKPKQMMSDHGTQFTSLPREGCLEPDPNEFQQWLQEDEIAQVKSRIKPPQSNGKIEKGGGIIRQLTTCLGSLERALYYYNFKRPHWSLNIEICETPFMAFIRKMRPEQRMEFIRAHKVLVARHAPDYIYLAEEIVK
jgi:transposase InsO family protein